MWDMTADYWISQSRKYCDFCKCWITDNKPSVEFHEKGRRHQENVKKRLRHITRQSNQTQKQNEQFDYAIKKIEAAALNAYKKDVENNADLSSLDINKRVQSDNLVIGGTSTASTSNSSGIDCAKKLWHEAKTRDGEKYYYNVITNERVWKPPKDGYMSVKELKEEADKKAVKQFKQVEKYNKQQALLKVQEVRQEEAEERSRLAREKLKQRRVKEDTPPPTYAPLIETGRTNPYGKWMTVKETTEESYVDLQLPEQEQEELEIPIDYYESEPIPREFKEKKVESLSVEIKSEGGEGGGGGFKKRRIGIGAKRNTRQRLDDD